MIRRQFIAIAGLSLLCALGGFITYQLASIPFGTAFTLSLNISLVSLVLVFFSVALVLSQSRRWWLQLTGVLPFLAGVAVLVVQIAVQADPRVLHYYGIPPSPTPQEWQEDARFLRNEMAEKHADLFSLVDSTKWESVTGEMVNRIPSLREPEILMELTRLAGFPGDGHTFPFIMAPCFDLHSFPLILHGFPEGWYVVRAARGMSDLTGTRLLAIQGIPIEKIYNTYPQLIAWENQQSRKEHFTHVAVMAEWLLYHGIISNTDEAAFTFRTVSGDTVVHTMASIPFWPYFMWSNITPIDNDEPPVYTAPRRDAYTFRPLEGGKALYIQFNQCVEPPEGPTATAFALDVERHLRDYPVERCIIDLRNNDGGQRIYTELLRVVRDNASINRRGRLFVLIGRRTFSAAVMFTTELQLQTNALFIGEPTGQGPIFYSRPRLIELPHSGLLFAVSSYHNVAGLPFDTRRAIEPDVAVPYGIEDFRHGRDPVLATALKYEEPAREQQKSSRADQRHIAGRYHHNETLVMDVVDSEDSPQLTITDGLPNTSVTFTSELREVSSTTYAARLADVSIRFVGRNIEAPSRAVIDWVGERVEFTRAAEGYELPFERFGQGDVTGACSMLQADPDKYKHLYPTLEAVLNRLGYQYLRGGRTSDALQVFELNVRFFPLSSNVYDSYGEALMVDDQIDSSLANYRRSLELNPENTNAERVIERLRSLQTD